MFGIRWLDIFQFGFERKGSLSWVFSEYDEGYSSEEDDALTFSVDLSFLDGFCLFVGSTFLRLS